MHKVGVRPPTALLYPYGMEEVELSILTRKDKLKESKIIAGEYQAIQI